MPAGWENTNLGAISSDATYGINAKAVAYDGKHKYIRITDIDEKTNKFAPNPLVSPDGEIKGKYKLKKGDILFARTGASVGKSYLYHEDDGNLYFAGFLIKFHLLKDNPYFIYAQTQTTKYWEWIQSVSMRSGQPGINAEEFKNLPLVIAPLPEQKAIAKTLQTWDTAIEKTETLIAAKRRQFEWLRSHAIKNTKNSSVKYFGDFLTESRIIDQKNNPRTRITVRLHLKGVEVRQYRGTESKDATDYFTRKAGQLIYGKQNIFRGAIGIVPNELDGYCSSQDIPAFDIAKNVHSDWLFWYMSRPHFYKGLEHFATGSGSKRLHPKELYQKKILIPTLPEQKQIARILNTAHREINLLKKQAQHYRTQKRGLMQKLLREN